MYKATTRGPIYYKINRESLRSHNSNDSHRSPRTGKTKLHQYVDSGCLYFPPKGTGAEIPHSLKVTTSVTLALALTFKQCPMSLCLCLCFCVRAPYHFVLLLQHATARPST